MMIDEVVSYESQVVCSETESDELLAFAFGACYLEKDSYNNITGIASPGALGITRLLTCAGIYMKLFFSNN
jgi:hypothetical protein